VVIPSLVPRTEQVMVRGGSKSDIVYTESKTGFLLLLLSKSDAAKIPGYCVDSVR
jgi:hypothetical protein